MVGLSDAVIALDFDLAAAARLLQWERETANALAEGLGEPSGGRRAKDVHW
jgi:hypothetical protein